ncbi:MAG: DUF2065 domain-containing protein [Ectothiorhodospiraceae bacterium]|nr:DUF2065 domain-containing protein [Chromatiales bacterium]MCP5157113.1 DUF2065 domain-containing protein [Ectothiorhodospiraceae bacterium]
MWLDFFSALALVLVIEGLMPFVNPQAWRNMVHRVAEMDDRSLRFAGLTCMVIGCVALWLLR